MNYNEILPGLDCGSCGHRTCDEFSGYLKDHPGELYRCIHLETNSVKDKCRTDSCSGCRIPGSDTRDTWKDSLGRDFDFLLGTFPNDPGPRETIRPHNPLISRELDIQVGDILIGRPLGMSCGCPVTHCGTVIEVDKKTGVMVWCVTGPLGPRHNDFKDIGYYSAEAYDGIVLDSRFELKIGMRYFFLPHRCMLQWRHSGLVNYLGRSKEGLSVRVEGLWIG